MGKEEELFDVVDKADNIVGIATRAQCHADPSLVHHTVQFAVYSSKNHKLLVAKRSPHADAAANQLAFFGEHIHSGESYLEALKRGLKEELGISSYTSRFLGQTDFIYDRQHEIVKFYLVTVPNTKVKLEKGKLSNKLWLSPKEVRNRISELAELTQYWVKNLSWFKK